VNEQGYEPPRLTLRAGAPSRITFVRTTDTTCGTEVVFLSLNIKRALPLNVPVVIEFTPQKSGDIAFACSMNMLHDGAPRLPSSASNQLGGCPCDCPCEL
jgi:plastocyanin domain-containing protein